MDESTTIGTRLRELRHWRGMTLAAVGGLAGVSPAYLSMAERGLRPLDRRSMISALAAALHVSETELTGGPHLGPDPLQSGPHAAIPALREALQTNSLTVPAADRARPLAEIVADVSHWIEPQFRNCDYLALGERLPGILDELHWHACCPADEAARATALNALTETCVIAGFLAHGLRYPDLHYCAAVRAGEAADMLDDPVMQGKAAFVKLHALPRGSRALAAAERAAAALEPHARGPVATQVLGLLTLTAAMSAAATMRPIAAADWATESGRLAARVPDDMSGAWQSFCATNVAVWRTAIGVELGESGGAVLELAAPVSAEKITAGSRRADFSTDVARGLARDSRTRTEAVRWLARAEKLAPQRVRNYAPARECVAFLMNRATATAGGRELRGMAARMGVPH
jgi:transcriptional regulator with XRE-family HTH domain